MQANLLIVDGISTNRIALNARLTAAWYNVTQAGSLPEALAALQTGAPDLIIIGSGLSDFTPEEAIHRLRDGEKMENFPVIALSDDDASHAALMRAGADDVLSNRCPDRFLLARIRSLLRAYSTVSEWQMRDDASQALGFAEAASGFERPAPVFFVQNAAIDADELTRGLGAELNLSAMSQAWSVLPLKGVDSVIALSMHPDDAATGFALLADLRARPDTRYSAILALVPAGELEMAAQALDMGADDTIIGAPEPLELKLRARRLWKRKQLADQLRASVRSGAEAAVADSLTGLHNRRYALPQLKRLTDQARAAGKPLAVMIADLDHFKQINDWHGHAAGDAVLVEAARRLKQNLRPDDLIARIGGEEFLIAMPGADRTAARQAALRLCQRMAEVPFDLPGTPASLKVTISIGLALTDRGVFSPEELMKRADAALYRAKQTGRNRYSISQRDAA